MTWQPMETAPEDGTLVRLKGVYPRTTEVVCIRGSYDSGGYSEGWEDERGNAFFPSEWMPEQASR